MWQYVIIAISFCMYLFAPRQVSSLFIWNCIFVYTFISVRILKDDLKREVPLSFNYLFLPFLFICSFIVPLINIYSDVSLIWFSSGLVKDYINISCALVVLATSLYSLGYYNGISLRSKQNISVINLPFVTKSLMILAVVIFIFQIRDNIIDVNKTNDFSDGYAIEIVQAIIYTTLYINIIKNRKSTDGTSVKFLLKNKVEFSCVLFILLGALYIGDRTLPIFLGIYILGLYVDYVKRIKIRYLFALAIPIFIIFYFIGRTRTTNNSIRDAGIEQFWSFASDQFTGANDIVVYMGDFMPSFITLDRALYICDRDKTYYHDPEKILVTAASPVPLLPSLISNTLIGKPVGELSSAHQITSDFNHTVQSISSGMGTHVVGDIYYHWSILGIFIAFPLFGYIIGKATSNRKDNVLSAIIFYTMVAAAIYVPRDTIYLSIRLIFYQWLLYSFIKLCSQSKIS